MLAFLGVVALRRQSSEEAIKYFLVQGLASGVFLGGVVGSF